MGAKMGRPKKDNPINIRTSVRFDKIIDKRLTSYCEENNLTKGETIRNAVILFLDKKI